MTRVLIFDGLRGPRRFQLIWTSLMSGGDGKGERSREIIRKEARLQDAFEPISDLAPTNGGPPLDPSQPTQRTLREGAHTVTLEQPDFDLLVTYTEKTPWTPHVSRDVVDLWDWLSAAEKRD